MSHHTGLLPSRAPQHLHCGTSKHALEIKTKAKEREKHNGMRKGSRIALHREFTLSIMGRSAILRDECDADVSVSYTGELTKRKNYDHNKRRWDKLETMYTSNVFFSLCPEGRLLLVEMC